jgi:type 1 glutamine amidotransferase
MDLMDRMTRFRKWPVPVLVAGVLVVLAAVVPTRGDSRMEPSGLELGDRGSAQRVLVFSRTTGFRHDSIPEAVAAIGRLGAEQGFGVDATEDPAVFEDGRLAPYRAVVFLLTTGDVLNEGQQAAFERYIRAGNGFVGVHSASDTEYGWAWYGGLVGAYFASHPPIQTATVLVEDRSHPSTSRLPESWGRTDEWYDFRANPRERVHVLARLDEGSYSGGRMGADHPIAWYHAYDGGRAWYTGGGHTRESYAEAAFLEHLLGGVRYAAGMVPSPPPEPTDPDRSSVAPPPDASVLLGEGDTSRWQRKDGPGPIAWPVVDGALEVCPGCGDIRSVGGFEDFRLHIEFRVPASAPEAAEQERGNSGIYLQGRYELQVLDSFGRPLEGKNDAGALYGVKDADANAALPPETWQVYDVVFRAARWNGGVETAAARVTVRWNGVLVHDDVELPGSTPGGEAESAAPGPILLQDHGDRVRYRNVWVQSIR